MQNEPHADGTSTSKANPSEDFQADLIAIQQIPAVPTILSVICRTTGMGFAAVARVTESRWIACGVRDEIGFGLQPGGELDVETTLCHEIRQSREGVVIDNVSEDETYCGHHTPATYGLQSYISLPIILPDGRFFGTLCAIDPRPAKVNTPEIVSMFKLFAELIAFHLDANQKIATSAVALVREQEISRLREEFIAVLGHDLRNPLAGVAGATRMLRKTPLNQHATSLVDMMHSSVQRMSGLVDNVLDFARGRLGGGITLNRLPDGPLLPVLEQVVLELKMSVPDRDIEVEFAIDKPVTCDAGRIGQLFSNLLGNAVTHGTAAAPIRVHAATTEKAFELSVANAGEPILPAAMERLFQPFARGEVRPSLQGLGLGLYIASEIARAHDGTLSATSSPEETRFTFRMPRT